MPVNEDTPFSDALDRTETDERRMSAELQRTIPGKYPQTGVSVIPEHANGTRNGIEEQHFRSMPRREVHEKLFRNFFELVLQRAVFQVSNLFHFYSFLCSLTVYTN